MGLTLHVGARSSGIDRLLTNRWRAGGGLLVARDDHSLGQALDAATADGAVWGCRAGAFATLFGRTRELAELPDSERRDGLALRCAITEEIDPPGAGHVAALERLILELRAARATPEAFAAAAEATGSAPLRTAARVYAAVVDIPSPDAPEWETVDAAGAVEIGPVYLVGFDDYAPVEWALLCALRTRNPVEAGLAYEQGRKTFCARHDRVAQWMAEADGVDHHGPAEPHDGIGLLERHLFEPQAPATAEGVEWLEAAGTDVSHRMAAERVVTALRAGKPPGQIAVVAPRLFEHLGGLRAALAEAGVASRAWRAVGAAAPGETWSVTFRADIATRHRSVDFITPTHPLVAALLAETEVADRPVTALRVRAASHVPGRYVFLVFLLQIHGARRGFELAPVALRVDGAVDPELSEQLLSALDDATSWTEAFDFPNDAQIELAHTRAEEWAATFGSERQTQLRRANDQILDRRVASLNESTQRLVGRQTELLNEARRKGQDSIVRLREGLIARKQSQLRTKLAEIEGQRHVDIGRELLAGGFLLVDDA
jgi:hypothetical protein